MKNKHKDDLYNILLLLSRNIFFYNIIKLPDNFETRIYLMFIHFSIIMIIFKEKGQKYSQKSYDLLFHNIENNLRELGFGDVSVNKKMKDFNKILYDILLKIKINKEEGSFMLNDKLIQKYFTPLNKNQKYELFKDYLERFYNFCFELSPENVLINIKKFK
ncbi:MAG: hypothetical protein CNB20_02280 [Pelagibacterales bacterium MED-G43]|nr:MAG: hypothetical protein CNB20_02280 [Pelagibacterales bacterium MED-G43]|tara:strand:+ start:489 stop:971 length:483 start_codon:yes stop_codon:yes gene_type:complete